MDDHLRHGHHGGPDALDDVAEPVAGGLEDPLLGQQLPARVELLARGVDLEARPARVMCLQREGHDRLAGAEPGRHPRRQGRLGPHGEGALAPGHEVLGARRPVGRGLATADLREERGPVGVLGIGHRLRGETGGVVRQAAAPAEVLVDFGRLLQRQRLRHARNVDMHRRHRQPVGDHPQGDPSLGIGHQRHRRDRAGPVEGPGHLEVDRAVGCERDGAVRHRGPEGVQHGDGHRLQPLWVLRQ